MCCYFDLLFSISPIPPPKFKQQKPPEKLRKGPQDRKPKKRRRPSTIFSEAAVMWTFLAVGYHPNHSKALSLVGSFFAGGFLWPQNCVVDLGWYRFYDCLIFEWVEESCCTYFCAKVLQCQHFGFSV